MIPISRARTKLRIAAPPNRYSDSRVRTTVKLVMIERANVWRIEWLTISANGSPAWRARFSRIRSKTTIVSWTLKPMTVSIAVTKRASISIRKIVPSIAKMPTTTITSWTSATSAVTPNFTSWNRYVIHNRIPIDPTRIRSRAWLTSSDETTAPIVVSVACSAIGPRAAWSALTISPPLPSVGSCVLPIAAGGVGEAEGEAPAPAEPLGAALADGAGLADAEGAGGPDGAADPDSAGEPDADAAGPPLAPGLPEGASVGTGGGDGAASRRPI